ncbi:hypothetical protein F0562_009803 [Nyssa sinensis]|uniref:Peptidase A1 domain-containing protein n=1 Tax=Nyssa sinensis TaxID=561372 RepID=A0A5J4ZYM1_9ASTE|nr:hypothetical protein F0562_009803 [Nyssa sinensis]
MAKCCWASSLLIILVSMSNALVWASWGEGQSETLRMELIHRHSPQLEAMGRSYGGGTPKTQLGRIRELLQSDSIRQQTIATKLQLNPRSVMMRRKATETDPSPTPSTDNSSDYKVSMQERIRSGADYGTGMYFVPFSVGTPAQKFVLVADTGSDLTWVYCKYSCRAGPKCKTPHNKTAFLAHHSSSFTTFPCSSEMCTTELATLNSLTLCPTPLRPCAYDMSYADGSSSQGIFANETVTVPLTNGKWMKLDNVLIGCSEAFRGGQALQVSDGILGLGYNKYSFALKATENFGGKFSYCLVDHLSHRNVSSYLILGGAQVNNSNNNNKTEQMKYTQLGLINSFYAVHIMGISVGGVMLDIPAEVWDLEVVGGAIVDSGSSLTHLAIPAYESVMAALKDSLLKVLGHVEATEGPTEYCFSSKGFDESLMPRFAFHFKDGVQFEPPVKSYVIDVAEGVKCLGFVPAAWPGFSTIGNIMQQNHIWEFDLVGSMLGFAPSTCT